ncbi:hypothetical protein [Cerasicoccus frondis]|uniref:hypothetical protein n=1 Tax=Cerasicoccus frondis TaxID=490090 RepID=UPI002852CC93|nr:hypothetical protein [Cerasicoccus frondis]
MKQTILVLLALLIANQALALDPASVATFDRRVISEDEVEYYEDETSLKPYVAYIDIVNFRTMSTPGGDRYAMVTLKNLMDGRQVLEPKDFVGIFADGNRVNPGFRTIMLESGETRTVVLPFGVSKFPLMKLLIDNQE